MQQRKPYLISKAFNQYLWASVFTVAATQIANIVDAAIVGNLIGSAGIAAVNLSKPILQAFFAISCLYVPAATILTGIAIGKGDTRRSGQLLSFSLIVSFVLGFLCLAGGMFFFGELSHALCPSETLYPLAADFMRVTIYSSLVQILMYTVHQFVTVDGSPRLVTYSIFIGNIVNIFLDIVFIKYCNMGIAGAAWATFTMYIVCILTALPHFRKKGTLRMQMPRLQDLELGKLFGIGLPLFFSTALLSVQYVGNNYVASTYLGDNGLVALGVCMQLFAFSMIILTGTLRTIQPVGSILRGMDDSMGMLMLMKRAYRFLGLCLAIYAAALILMPSQIAALLGVNDKMGMQMVVTALPLFTFHIVMQALLYNLMPIFQLYDRKHLALFLSISQTLMPMIVFYLTRGNWLGFFFGQLITAIVIVVWCAVLRRRDTSLTPIFLIPMKKSTQVFETTATASLSSLSQTIDQLQTFLRQNGISSRNVFHASLCTEEFLKNIIQHGKAHAIDVGATIADGVINITIHDDGAPFNPIAFAHDIPEKIGLGLTLAQATTQSIDYKFLFNQNMLTLKIGDPAQ